MATRERFFKSEIRKENPLFSPLRAVIESAMYENNVRTVKGIEEAYLMAKKSQHTIVTDLDVKYPEKLDLPENTKVLVENGGAVVGRTAAARRIVGENEEEDMKLSAIIRDAVYSGAERKRFRAAAYIGLDREFMVKAHLSVPEGQENNLYSWLSNFQITNDKYNKMYADSVEIPEGDIFIYSDPCWKHPEYPLGLAYFDPDHNAAIILGMNYFGELKKATLTLTWNIAHHIGYVSCHGGQKKFSLTDGKSYVSAFFGLSGSGKSTLTHAKHDQKYEIDVLHDDAFIISLLDGSSIALEPAYFDKTQDYPSDHKEVDYFLTVQNVAVVLDNNAKKVLLTEDLRNGNGRTVKSRYSTPNRLDRFDEPIDAIYWIMKDECLPPVIKITDPVLASTFGATLATKRSSAEQLKQNADADRLVIEPYANPFRVYPLVEDYDHFKQLFEQRGIDCYILNTGFFLNQKISKEVTLSSIESIVDETAEFKAFGLMKHVAYLDLEDYRPDFDDQTYKNLVKTRMRMRTDYIENEKAKDGMNVLPDEALKAMKNLIIENVT